MSSPFYPRLYQTSSMEEHKSVAIDIFKSAEFEQLMRKDQCAQLVASYADIDALNRKTTISKISAATSGEDIEDIIDNYIDNRVYYKSPSVVPIAIEVPMQSLSPQPRKLETSLTIQDDVYKSKNNLEALGSVAAVVSVPVIIGVAIGVVIGRRFPKQLLKKFTIKKLSVPNVTN